MGKGGTKMNRKYGFPSVSLPLTRQKRRVQARNRRAVLAPQGNYGNPESSNIVFRRSRSTFLELVYCY
ncbi:hypothetical protein GOODEAATRI_031713 [Goodea atripinnis]|uniref:Ribosomal protein L32 n=1 Tax=Goodea atripinnis TaxID=208336 RepID=A0ABV0PIL9_9TELE